MDCDDGARCCVIPGGPPHSWRDEFVYVDAGTIARGTVDGRGWGGREDTPSSGRAAGVPSW